jgi:hypothetical protein
VFSKKTIAVKKQNRDLAKNALSFADMPYCQKKGELTIDILLFSLNCSNVYYIFIICT